MNPYEKLVQEAVVLFNNAESDDDFVKADKMIEDAAYGTMDLDVLRIAVKIKFRCSYVYENLLWRVAEESLYEIANLFIKEMDTALDILDRLNSRPEVTQEQYEEYEQYRWRFHELKGICYWDLKDYELSNKALYSARLFGSNRAKLYLARNIYNMNEELDEQQMEAIMRYLEEYVANFSMVCAADKYEFNQACNSLADNYESGIGTERNTEKAEYYRSLVVK